MRMYYLWASTYESVELMEKHHESDYALDLLSRRVSDPYYALAESPQDAAEPFRMLLWRKLHLYLHPMLWTKSQKRNSCLMRVF